jgi:hypothetical protein
MPFDGGSADANDIATLHLKPQAEIARFVAIGTVQTHD